MIGSEYNFNQLVNILKNGSSDPKILDIKPKTQRDFLYIGINNQMKALKPSVIKLQRFI